MWVYVNSSTVTAVKEMVKVCPKSKVPEFTLRRNIVGPTPGPRPVWTKTNVYILLLGNIYLDKCLPPGGDVSLSECDHAKIGRENILINSSILIVFNHWLIKRRCSSQCWSTIFIFARHIAVVTKLNVATKLCNCRLAKMCPPETLDNRYIFRLWNWK